MSDGPAQAGNYYKLGKLRFEHQLDGRWGVSNGMLGVGNRRTPLGAWLALHRVPHATIRAQRAITRLRLYRPLMKALHRAGQCYMTTHHMEDGVVRRCSWCGHSYRPYDPVAAEESLRKAVAESSLDGDPATDPH